MRETKKNKITNYTMKMKLFPSRAQAQKIDAILKALHIAYNMTFHEVFEHNPDVCTEPNTKGDFWPDYNKMAKALWKNHLIEMNPLVGEAPAASITTNNGLFLHDAKQAWENGMHNRPVNKADRKEFHFYNKDKPRSSFMIQMSAKKLVPSVDNPKVAWVEITNVGKIKARGFNRKIWFGHEGEHSFSEAVEHKEVANALTVRISKDSCGDYFISVTISDGKKHEFNIFRETIYETDSKDVGIDVGIKDIAILSDGTKFENKRFKRQEDPTLRRLGRQLSRRWGPANSAYRDYCKEIRKEAEKAGEVKPEVSPGKRYLETKLKRARIELRINNRRETYQHQVTAAITSESSLIGIETLHVKNMMRNHKLAYALSDAGMSSFLSKLKYKADRMGTELRTIGVFEPSSQTCSGCGYINQDIKNLDIREWICPQCGIKHDRDVNAAKNILQLAITKGSSEDKELSETAKKKKHTGIRKPRDNVITEDHPEIVVVYSKELTKINNPRYVIINRTTGNIIDDAQGTGYRSVSNAKNCYKAKIKWSQNIK